MTNAEALEILDHNWTRLVNSDYTDIELGQAQDLAIKALEEWNRMKLVCANEGIVVYKLLDKEAQNE